MAQRIRRLALVVAVIAGSALAVEGHAAALPANAAKIGMICTPGAVAGSTHTFNLRATSGYVQTPDGNSVFMWSFANVDAPDSGHFQYPGPVLCVTQGQTVVVNLHNALSEPASVVFPGQQGVTASGGGAGLLTTEAASNGNVSYTFTAANPGTYLYESGSDVSKQIEMGLYGALIVRPSIGAGYAYDSTTRFDPTREYLQLLSEFDPDLHAAVERGTTYDFTKLHNRYYAINGRDFPDTVQDNGVDWLPNQPYGALVRIQPNDATKNPYPALIRMLNVGAVNHPFHPHGNHLREIAQDGRLILSPGGGSASTERFAETIGSGQTQDYLLRWDENEHWGPNPTDAHLPAQPNYRNLFFKDGVTWYAGNPYLGYKGTLPTGTASLNLCGEWYFPLHSHALNEFSNFDAGFGGMGTLLRVDPLGGCFTFPTAAKILSGSLAGGGFGNLAADDAKFYQVNSTTSGLRTTNWYGQFGGVAAGATNLAVTYKGHISRTAAGTAQRVFVWNWATSAWVQVAGPTTVGTADVTQGPVAVPGAPADFIGTGANAGRVRVRVLTTRTGGLNFVTSGNLMKLVYDAP
ncbi:MAG: multicopper oxidase domain-containing protein [Actinomycetota bacterium]|nr:multicopper oxidase domain-containing protein [Actinomycetota bacterium]